VDKIGETGRGLPCGKEPEKTAELTCWRRHDGMGQSLAPCGARETEEEERLGEISAGKIND
jgi:hypothetical protein